MKHTCTRCGRIGRDRGNWNYACKAGHVVAVICPACQSAAENAEAEINMATTDYAGVNAYGQLVGRPKA
jgi:hypothetical protein